MRWSCTYLSSKISSGGRPYTSASFSCMSRRKRSAFMVLVTLGRDTPIISAATGWVIPVRAGRVFRMVTRSKPICFRLRTAARTFSSCLMCDILLACVMNSGRSCLPDGAGILVRSPESGMIHFTPKRPPTTETARCQLIRHVLPTSPNELG